MPSTIQARLMTAAGPVTAEVPATRATCTTDGCGNKGIEMLFPDDGSDVICICGTILRQPYPMPDAYKTAIEAAGGTVPA